MNVMASRSMSAVIGSPRVSNAVINSCADRVGLVCHLQLQPQFFRQLGQVLERQFQLLLLRGLVVAQFFKFDAAVAVNFAACQAVGLNLLPRRSDRSFR